MKWQQTGTLGEPEAVKQAVAEYRDQQDILHEFLVERCFLKKSVSIDQSELYKVYKRWCGDNDTYVISKPNFSNRIREKGVIAGRRHGNKAIWKGIRLLTDDETVNTVNQGSQFTESFLHEDNTGKTLHKTVNDVSPLNPTIPDNQNFSGKLPDCPAYGHNEWAYSPEGDLVYLCDYLIKESL